MAAFRAVPFDLGAEFTARRVVEQPGGIVTAAGVSSGIDMALRPAELIAGRVAAEAFQLAIEYDPQPPFDSGSYAKASQEAKDYVAARPRRPARVASPEGGTTKAPESPIKA